jgi:hypothetical protein
LTDLLAKTELPDRAPTAEEMAEEIPTPNESPKNTSPYCSLRLNKVSDNFMLEVIPGGDPERVVLDMTDMPPNGGEKQVFPLLRTAEQESANPEFAVYLASVDSPSGTSACGLYYWWGKEIKQPPLCSLTYQFKGKDKKTSYTLKIAVDGKPDEIKLDGKVITGRSWDFEYTSPRIMKLLVSNSYGFSECSVLVVRK